MEMPFDRVGLDSHFVEAIRLTLPQELVIVRFLYGMEFQI